jgi:cell division protein ZapA
MKQVEVTILGQSYLLMCPDGGEAPLQSAVSAVDREMSGIRDAGKVKARERIAVLAALNLAYRLAESPRAGAPSASAPAEPDAGAPAGRPGDPAQHVPHTEASEARRAAAAQVEMLIARLDAALSEDGRLL